MQNRKTLALFLINIILFYLGWFFLFVFLDKLFGMGRNIFFGVDLPWSWVVFFMLTFFFAFSLFYIFILASGNRKLTYALFFLSILPAVFFSKERFFQVIPLLAVSSLVGILAIKLIKYDEKLFNKIIPPFILRRGAPIIFIIFSLLLSANFYFSFSGANFFEKDFSEKSSFKIPMVVFQGVFRAVDYFSFSKEARAVIEQRTLGEYLQGLSPEERERSLSLLTEKMGREVSRETTVEEIYYELLNKQFSSVLSNDFRIYRTLPWGLAIATFLAISSLFWLFRFPIFWTSWLFLIILLKLGWIKLEKEMAEREVLKV